MRGILNGSKEGYEKGFDDGADGRPRKAIGSIGEAFAHAVRPKSYTETFLRAYGRGYDDGNRSRKRDLAEAEERAKKKEERDRRAREEALEYARPQARARGYGRKDGPSGR